MNRQTDKRTNGWTDNANSRVASRPKMNCNVGLEVIFIIGRYPMRSGIFNTMYYTIVKRVIKYVLAMLFMVAGYAFAFMVVQYGHDTQSFTSPFKSIVKTLIMTLGEYDFDALYEGFMDDNYID